MHVCYTCEYSYKYYLWCNFGTWKVESSDNASRAATSIVSSTLLHIYGVHKGILVILLLLVRRHKVQARRVLELQRRRHPPQHYAAATQGLGGGRHSNLQRRRQPPQRGRDRVRAAKSLPNVEDCRHCLFKKVCEFGVVPGRAGEDRRVHEPSWAAASAYLLRC
jgi:hypothetical protein